MGIDPGIGITGYSFIEYKNKDGIFGKIKTLEINFDKISKKQKVKK